jgi:hypothetical protein
LKITQAVNFDASGDRTFTVEADNESDLIKEQLHLCENWPLVARFASMYALILQFRKQNEQDLQVLTDKVDAIMHKAGYLDEDQHL